LQVQYGGGMDDPIWRFRLPTPDHPASLPAAGSGMDEKKN
jgi:hypothetical protein